MLCPPFGEEAELTRRNLHELGVRLSGAGVVTTLIDVSGTGNSAGDMTNLRLETWVDDIKWSAARLGDEFQVDTVGLIGVRFGAVLALLASEKLERLGDLVLWDPPTKIGWEFRNMSRRHLVRTSLTNTPPLQTATRVDPDCTVTDLDGYPIDSDFLAELRSLNWKDMSGLNRARVEIALFALRDPDRLASLSDTIQQIAPNGKISRRRLRQPCPRFWARLGVVVAVELLEETVTWIVEQARRRDENATPHHKKSS